MEAPVYRLVRVVTCIALLGVGSAAGAQIRERTLLGVGFVSPVNDPGLHMFSAFDFAPQRSLRPRVDLILEQSHERELFALGNLVYAPWKNRRLPYAIAGGGLYLEAGSPFMTTIGAGVNLDDVWRAPLLVEARILTAPDAHLMLTLALRP